MRPDALDLAASASPILDKTGASARESRRSRRRLEDDRFLRGLGRYLDDIPAEGQGGGGHEHGSKTPAPGVKLLPKP